MYNYITHKHTIINHITHKHAVVEELLYIINELATLQAYIQTQKLRTN